MTQRNTYFQDEVVERDKIDIKNLKRLLRYATPHKKLFVFVLVVMLIAVVSSMITPLLLQYIVDTVIPEHSRYGGYRQFFLAVGGFVICGLAEEMEADALNSFLSRKVDGIIAVPVGESPEMLERISRSVPVVLIDRYFPDTTLPYVCTDNYYGGLSATRHLIRKGYRNLLAIQGVLTSMPNKERVRGFNDAIAAHKSEGMQGSVSGSSFSVENGISETLRIMSGKVRPDAIFAFGTTILLGVINTIKSMGLSVPDDVALISFDDNLFFDYMDPPITRVAQPVAEISHLASDILLKMINGEVDEDEVCKMQLLPKLIHGRSC